MKSLFYFGKLEKIFDKLTEGTAISLGLQTSLLKDRNFETRVGTHKTSYDNIK
jgi:hypothetical protein